MSGLMIGEAIWYARERCGLTQAQLAAHLLISRPQIANLETGRGNPSVETLEHVARVLGCRFATDGDYWYVLPASGRVDEQGDALTRRRV